MKILLAEASVRDRLSMVESLQLLGHVVQVVDNGLEAIRRLRAGRFDVAILDAKLLVLDGCSVIRVIRQYLPEASQPWVVISCEPGDPAPAWMPGANEAWSTLSKPASMSDLARVVELASSGARPKGTVDEDRGDILDVEAISAMVGEEITTVIALGSQDHSFLFEFGQIFAGHGMDMLHKMHNATVNADRNAMLGFVEELKKAGQPVGARRLIRACEAMQEGGAEPEAFSAVVGEFLRATDALWSLISASRPQATHEALDCIVYLVDDEERNLKLLEKMLRKSGYHRILSTTSPVLFETMVGELLPDLVLLDCHMPILTGLELLPRLGILHHAAPPVPVLMLTGDGRTDVRRGALQQGARDFVTKPFDPPEVLARIANLLEARVARKQLLQQKLQLEEQVTERTLELRESRLDVVRRLAVAAEYRDDETGMHIRRVGRYSALLAQTMGLSEEICECILHAAQLHDIGKIGIPDRVLLKPGKLDAEEWEIMKSHARLGWEILRGGQCELLRVAEDIALTHHERWDGRGYPRGIPGEEIPLAGRIVCVCDVFDALTSERPYKRAWSISDAVQEIRSCSSTQFDPVLVEKFVQIVPQILEVREVLNSGASAALAS